MSDDNSENTLVFKARDTQLLRRRRRSEQLTLPTIRVVAGPDLLRFCSIYPGERVIIGREEECGLPLADPSVSRRHAVISSDEQGTLTLEDLGSTNGTSYRGEPVTDTPVTIHHGEQIQIGSVTLRIDLLGLDELTHLARVVDRLNQAAKDQLTGLLGRRYLDEELPRQVSRYHKAHIPVSAVFLDVDHFKSFNDNLGHAAGDEVLRTVARLLVMCVRDSDNAARYGGEEFVLILPNCDRKGGGRLAERVRARIESYDWASHLGVPEATVTVSLGVAQFHGGDVKAWLEAADHAMYEAKRSGRNQVKLAPE